jgi:uncharacterized membrane protein
MATGAPKTEPEPQPESEISAHPGRARAAWHAVVLLVSLLHLFKHFLNIGHRELWLDEASTFGVAARGLGRVFTLPVEFHSQPPLYYLLLHFVMKVSSAEWFMRGLSWLFCWLLLVFILYGLRELGRFARLFFALLFVFNDYTHYLAQELRPYALAVVTSFLATILLLRLLGRPARRGAILYGLAAVGMLYTLAFDVWVFISHGLAVAAVLLHAARRDGITAALRRHVPTLTAVAAVGLLYLPYLILVVHWQLNPGPGWRAALAQASRAAVYTEGVRGLLQLQFPLLQAVYALIALAAADRLARRSGEPLLWLLLVAGHLAFVHGFLLGRTGVQNRYYAPAFPVLLYVIATGLDRLMPRVTRLVWPVTLAALAVTACLLWEPFAAYARAPQPRGGWRQIHDRIRALPGRKVIFFDTGYEGQMLEYEARHDRDLAFRTQKGSGWASGGDNHLDPDYVERSLREEEAATSCFLYFVDKGPQSPFFSTFVPMVQQLGYGPVPSPGDKIHAYCRRVP